ncbi:hypothetical protein [Rubrobacter marinus]|uniref:hypothetical protein n=1 Tax=Rubrobacter marinus TaxID=2653852 RepID=UPI00389ACBC2
MLGYPPVFTAAVFGAMTALTTFAGLQLGASSPASYPSAQTSSAAWGSRSWRSCWYWDTRS